MEKLKSAGAAVIGLAVTAGSILTLALLPLTFAVKFLNYRLPTAIEVTPLLMRLGILIIVADILILLLLIPAPRTRLWAAVPLYFTFLLFGSTAWLYAVLITYTFWGLFGMAIGILLAGTGSFVLAIFASILNGHWDVFGALIFGLSAASGAYIAAARILELGQQEDPDE